MVQCAGSEPLPARVSLTMNGKLLKPDGEVRTLNYSARRLKAQEADRRLNEAGDLFNPLRTDRPVPTPVDTHAGRMI